MAMRETCEVVGDGGRRVINKADLSEYEARGYELLDPSTEEPVSSVEGEGEGEGEETGEEATASTEYTDE